MEQTLFLWFKQKREDGIPISGPILQTKAWDLFKKLHPESSEQFAASNGWLWRFCQRHGIRQLSLQGEKLSADRQAAEEFIPKFRKFIEENNYTLSQVFNCDESGLYYKLLPEKSLAAQFEKSADGRKTQKERVTISACSNATGSIKLPLLLIGKSKNPCCLNIPRDSLPVEYASQSNAWVNSPIFLNWFHHSFVPFVRKKLIEMGLEPKAVLLLDNCSAHPNDDELVSADGKFVAKFLPANVTSLIQPMDQGVLVAIKRRYKRKLLEELVLEDGNGMSVIDFLKRINILKVAELVASSWDEIDESTLRLSWRKILFDTDAQGQQSSDDYAENVDTDAQGQQSSNDYAENVDTDAQGQQSSNDYAENVDTDAQGQQSSDDYAEIVDSSCTSVSEIISFFQQVGQDVSHSEIEDWLRIDDGDSGYQHLTDNLHN